MFSTDFVFRQQENLVDNQKCQAGFRPLCNKIPLLSKIQIKWEIVSNFCGLFIISELCLRIFNRLLNIPWYINQINGSFYRKVQSKK